jgi:adenine-specific DNA-methyltransferase
VLNRYLGNKTVLLDDILQIVGEAAQPGDLVCDVFSGSLAVSLGLKRAGYRVAANDINLFSAVLGRAFLLNHEIPATTLEELVPRRSLTTMLSQAEAELDLYRGQPGYAFVDDPRHTPRLP